MRTSALLLVGVLASAAVMPASAGSPYSKCVKTADPAECIARRAVKSFGLQPEYALDTVLRHGLVDVVPQQWGKMMRGLYKTIGKHPPTILTPVGKPLESAENSLRKSPRSSVLAAMALVAAAKRDTNPFANPIYRKLASQAKDDQRIPALALALWWEIMRDNGWPPDFRVTHAGLESIWDRAEARKEKDAVLLQYIAVRLAWYEDLKPRMREFLLWYAQRPGLTPYERVDLAAELLRSFDLSEEAAVLMKGVGDDVDGQNVPGVRAEIARLRLLSQYDAESAHLLVAVMLEHLSLFDGYLGIPRERELKKELNALERSGAREELRMLGSESLRRAQAAEEKTVAANWYAAASEFYLRAGDRELAQEIARRGLPGAAGAVALYRSGAIDEALQTGDLSGTDRYFNAARAGEKQDAQWVFDEGWPLYLSVMALEAKRSTDREFQQRVYDGLVRSCGEPFADCFEGRLRDIAQVAAGMGEEARMQEALAAAAGQLDEAYYKGYSALYVAGPWAHCEEVLRAAIRLRSPALGSTGNEGL